MWAGSLRGYDVSVVVEPHRLGIDPAGVLLAKTWFGEEGVLNGIDAINSILQRLPLKARGNRGCFYQRVPGWHLMGM